MEVKTTVHCFSHTFESWLLAVRKKMIIIRGLILLLEINDKISTLLLFIFLMETIYNISDRKHPRRSERVKKETWKHQQAERKELTRSNLLQHFEFEF